MNSRPKSTETAGGPRPHRLLAELRPGERVEDEIYRIAGRELRTASNGSYYIHAVLADRSGQMVARMWNAAPTLFDSIAASPLLHIRGYVDTYKGKPQMILEGLRVVEEGSVDPAEFLPTTSCDVNALWARLKEILRTIRDPDLLALVGKFINDEAFAARFRQAPAARNMHHAYVGGLIEHTVGLLELALVVLPRYPRVNADLVLAALFLHDAGKTAELTYESNFDYTTEGQLLGHIVQATIWVHERARQLEQETGRPFPEPMLTLLKHVIVAHHGKYEFGSPKLPAIPEAVLVHYLDNLDAKLTMMFSAIDNDLNEASEWTEWVGALETRVFKGRPRK